MTAAHNSAQIRIAKTVLVLMFRRRCIALFPRSEERKHQKGGLPTAPWTAKPNRACDHVVPCIDWAEDYGTGEAYVRMLTPTCQPRLGVANVRHFLKRSWAPAPSAIVDTALGAGVEE